MPEWSTPWIIIMAASSTTFATSEMLENSVIVFLSDNGANPFYSTDYPSAADPEFVGLFDHSLENLRDPGSNYAYGPGIAQGQATDAFTYVRDILPTLLDMTGVAYPATYDGHNVEKPRGRSMVPLLNGETQDVYGPDDFVGREMGEGKWMPRGSYKAILVPSPYGDNAWHLFNVDLDTGETNDLAAEIPELLETLKAAWDEYAADVGVVPAEL